MLEEQKRKLCLLLDDKETLRAFFDMLRIMSALLFMLMCIHYAAMSNADTTPFYLLSFTFFFLIAVVPIISDMHRMSEGSGKETSNARTATMIITACSMGISFFYILTKMVNAVENPLTAMSTCGYIFCYCINMCLMFLPVAWLTVRAVEHYMYKNGIYGNDGSREADINQGELSHDAKSEASADNVPANEALRVHDNDTEKSTDVDRVFTSEVTVLLDKQRREEALSL